jgi:heme/copper-type cytochrome/quinol oxidase subunit 3
MTPLATITEFPGRPARLGRLADHGVFGMALFVFAEVMLFAGFISAYLIMERSAAPGTWPPPDQPRLPVASTAFNTAALLVSGVCLFVAYRAFRRARLGLAERWMLAAIGLGALFVGLQGAEWARLLAQGLTLQSSQIGAFFYLIVGAHAMHAVIAIGLLAFTWTRLRAGRLTRSAFGAAQLFWYFVVLLWPVLYLEVYL